MANDAPQKPPLMPSVNRLIGDNIRRQRMSRRVTRRTLVKTLSLSQTQLRDIEFGLGRCSPSQLAELARALEVSVSVFFAGLEEVEDQEMCAPTSAS
jgi:transcriptional regulator with XRE-family HTH domain